ATLSNFAVRGSLPFPELPGNHRSLEEIRSLSNTVHAYRSVYGADAEEQPAAQSGRVAHFYGEVDYDGLDVEGMARALRESAVARLADKRSKVESKVEEMPLTNEDIGLNPQLPTNYDVDRLEAVTVPGPVD